MSGLKLSISAGLFGCALTSSVFVHAAFEITGLRADTYSATAAELFWDRAPNTYMIFEVARDDGAVDFTDGTSYFDSARTPGVSYTYTVTAVNASGEHVDSEEISIGEYSPDGLQVKHLRGDVYSSTAAELFWVKDSDRKCTYEIIRNDGVAVTTDGDSYFDDSREAGVQYEYTVTAIDPDGNRSQSVAITLAPFSYSLINSPQATGVRYTLYSAVAVELHWDRIPNRHMRYEILRDDGLSNITNGVSYYDNQRVPGQANTYFIVAIDEEGNRSAPVTIDVPAI